MEHGGKLQEPARGLGGAIEALNPVAERQEGFFTAAQAQAATVDGYLLARLMDQGVVERDRRGIYRIKPYPVSDRAEFWRAVLAPSVQRVEPIPAILCNGTALDLYEISTINPRMIEVAVPRAARMRGDLPKSVVYHRRDYADTDITSLFGLPVTTLYRTLQDLIVAKRDLQFVDEALAIAPNRGLLTSSDLMTITYMRKLASHISFSLDA